MNIARILILALAAVAAVVAAIFVRDAMQPSAAPSEPVAEVREAAPSVRVLAARGEFAAGHRIQPADLYWQAWPEEALSPAYVTEAGRPEAITDFAGAVVRSPMAQGEPVSERKLVQPGEAGFMAAVIAPGMRAVAVPTSAQAGAGGFILPNDRVDVIVTMDVEDRMTSRMLVENVRVLAIDQTYSEEEEGAVVGSTATLELTPGQAEQVALAVAAGDIALALRSVADTAGGPQSGAIAPAEPVGEAAPRSVRVVRYGQEHRVALGGGQ